MTVKNPCSAGHSAASYVNSWKVVNGCAPVPML